MVADLRTRLPPQLLVGDRGAHLAPVAQVFDGGGERDTRDAGGVAQDVADGHLLLAVGAVLRDVVGHPVRDVQRAPLLEHVHDHRRDRLRG